MRALVLPLLLVAEIAVFTSLAGVDIQTAADFWEYFRWYATDVLTQGAPVLVLSLGMTLVLMTAGIDLSVGSMVALVACLMSLFEPGPAFWATALPAGLVAGLLLGCFNGLLIARVDMPPIIATLGTMIFYRGLCYVVLGDREQAPFLSVPGYAWLGTVTAVLVMLAVLFLAGGSWFRLSRRREELLMLGGNSVAARYAGIPTARRLVEVYTLMGGLCFVAALAFTARNGSVSASALSGLELQVIVAVVLGGTRVEGGRGSLGGALLGGLLVAVLDDGLRTSAAWGQEHLPFKISHLRYVLLGTLLIVGVWLNTHVGTGWRRKRRLATPRPSLP